MIDFRSRRGHRRTEPWRCSSNRPMNKVAKGTPPTAPIDQLAAASLFLSDVLTAPRISTELRGHAVEEEVKQPCNQRRRADRGPGVETGSEERFRHRVKSQNFAQHSRRPKREPPDERTCGD